MTAQEVMSASDPEQSLHIMAKPAVECPNSITASPCDVLPRPDSNATARRSISIFSRRGVDTPPSPPLILQEAMPISRQMTERQKNWLNRRRSILRSTTSNSPKSASWSEKVKPTVLKAVPQASKRKVSALEKKTTTSPNEVISSVIGADPAESTLNAPESKQSASLTSKSAWNSNAALHSSHDETSEKRKSAEHRVGVWMKGVTQWDPAMQYRAVLDNLSIADEADAPPVCHVPNKAAATLGVRPNLSVVIPGNQPSQDLASSTLAQPKPQDTGLSESTPDLISKFNIMATPESNKDPHSSSRLDLDCDLGTLAIEPVVTPAMLDPTSQPSRSSGSRTSSKSSSYGEIDDASVYSKRSSATSFDTGILVNSSLKRRHSRNLLSTPLSQRPDPKARESKRADVNKPLPPDPTPSPTHEAPGVTLVSNIGAPLPRLRSVDSAPDGTEWRRGHRKTKSASRSRSWSQLDSKLDAFDLKFMATAPYMPQTSAPTSPTLTEAADDLEAHLTKLTETADIPEVPVIPPQEMQTAQSSTDDTTRFTRQKDSVSTVMNPPERAPTLPKRSRKREWRMPTQTAEVPELSPFKYLSRRKSDSQARPTQKYENGRPIIHRRKSAHPCIGQGTPPAPTTAPPPVPGTFKTTALSSIDEIDTYKEVCPFAFDDGLIVVQGPVVFGEDDQQMLPTAVAAATAEEVLLHVLSSLDSTEDLLNTVLMNKGMYRVFKENEMHLIRMVTYNGSPAAWELRQWCPPQQTALEPESGKASSMLEHTPTSYMQCHRRDARVIKNLKALLLQECPTCLRKETASAFADSSSPDNKRFDDAFWRIWCFCKIFGCEKGREDDVAGQIDWLRGGEQADNQGFSATVSTNWEHDTNSVLFNPPDHFAKGNEGGLSAEQLYDMTEIWTCLTTLLHGYQGRVSQARAAGVFDDCDIKEGDQEKEERMLEEWIFYLLTLGPNVVLEMAAFATNGSHAGFAHAKANAWTIWSPQQFAGSRRTFLKEPVARLYEERISAATIQQQSPRDLLAKEVARKRVASLAAEIKLARQKSAYRRSPYIDMSKERPMSMMSRRDSATSARSARTSISSAASRRTPVTPVFPSVSTPRSPSKWSARKISPIVEDCAESFNKLSLVKTAGLRYDSSWIQVRKIMDMGFTSEQATWALKMTCSGEGLHVDRAVNMLLQQQRT